MTAITISARPSDDALIDAILAHAPLSPKPIRRDRITGGGELLTVMITVTPVLVPSGGS